MSSARIAVEWGFGKIKGNFAYLDFAKGMRPYQSDIQKFWPVAQILTNCHTCFYGSQTSRYFDLKPPSVEVYLFMGANLGSVLVKCEIILHIVLFAHPCVELCHSETRARHKRTCTPPRGAIDNKGAREPRAACGVCPLSTFAAPGLP